MMQTGRFLIVVWPEASAYNATFHLARVLHQRGHEVVYAVPPRWQLPVSRQGFETVSLDVSVSLLAAPTERHSIMAGRDEARKRIDGLRQALAWLGSAGFSLALVQPTLWHYALVFRRLGIPSVPVDACLASTWNSKIPPVFSGLQPLLFRPVLNRLWCAGAWLALRYLGAFSHRYHGIIQPRASHWLARFRVARVTARHFFRSVFEPLSMPVYHAALRIARREGVAIRWGDYGDRLAGTQLVLGPRALDFPGHPEGHLRVYAGASVDTERVEDCFDWSRVDPRKPLVYCAVGSHGPYWNAENLLRLTEAIVGSFKAHPEYHVLLQTISENECERLRPLPDTIMAASWFPQLQILARASLLITHGGFGTVREALFFGVPMIVFPCGVDQPGNAARVTQAGVGIRGDIRTVTAATISSMVQVVRMPPYRENALRLSRTLQEDKGCSEAVAVIESVLGEDTANSGRRGDHTWTRCASRTRP